MINVGLAKLASLIALALMLQACSPTTRSAAVGTGSTTAGPQSPPAEALPSVDVSAVDTSPLALAEVSDARAWQVEDWDPRVIYDEKLDGQFQLARIDPAKVKPRNVRQVVDFRTKEPPGTIVVNTTQHSLFFVLPDGKAVRYGIGVGAAGLSFEGEAVVEHKQQWPRWIPTKDMIKRSPDHYAKYADGVDGGLGNPLGARALYMFQNGIDTYYRIHGTNDPSSIGRSVSAGCIRMFNQDVVDLYERVQPGARVIVTSHDAPARAASRPARTKSAS
ncbi:lipoprotein-anchoring transpeptidase ErfK/SrfK [Pseudochelatococcus lubricantis]|uniref:Lipoprotein-anchoring transpeptidase ErfK/SrfK n=1 Tax=Pseudochelatococcus lubricantis TaxID=1538102 RepID=A0ABX0V1I8_9HYPH|nr:L,D-transpeptidase [Pseudochelatococcus lubricantis]NIJ59066.1 lipoprotein-anchoring transpeptidase ErfK/SrfK [Pseudochelatococcus lubricantis]